ncbi:MAG: hypothetical protein O2992_04245 [Gemmatimonadetes bacterium]|jgi:hypothetical protein|nr:hypothetical protein [Gemmatimonadota bacterium]
MTPWGTVAGLLGVLCAAGCAPTVGPGASGSFDLAPGDPDAVHVVYLGTGGWIFERGADQVLAAPLFSNPGFFTTGLAPIRSDTLEVDRFMGLYDVSRARVILVGHAHYDHLMDVPRVALRHAPSARIAGSRTVQNTLGDWSGVADRVDLLEASAGDEQTVGKWMPYGDAVRIMPLRSKHAPHFDGMTLYEGTRDVPVEHEPRWATEWLEGETHAFLVDFLDGDGSVAYRIYYQDAVAPAPAGFAPDAVILEHPVDLAIFVPATFDQVEWHPEAFVQNLRPRRVLLGHWENFFVPVDTPATSIVLTDFAHFESRLERVFSGEWWRPDRWTEFRFPTH